MRGCQPHAVNFLGTLAQQGIPPRTFSFSPLVSEPHPETQFQPAASKPSWPNPAGWWARRSELKPDKSDSKEGDEYEGTSETRPGVGKSLSGRAGDTRLQSRTSGSLPESGLPGRYLAHRAKNGSSLKAASLMRTPKKTTSFEVVCTLCFRSVNKWSLNLQMCWRAIYLLAMGSDRHNGM